MWKARLYGIHFVEASDQVSDANTTRKVFAVETIPREGRILSVPMQCTIGLHSLPSSRIATFAEDDDFLEAARRSLQV